MRAAASGLPVFVDGGIRSPESALAGLALGASLVFVGRPVLWALACGGADGVRAWLEDLTERPGPRRWRWPAPPSVAALPALGIVADPGSGLCG